jgi:ABC-type amino acid transport substrate-binding protein
LLLDKKRVDIFLDDHYSVLYAASQMNLTQPLFSQPLILAVPTYHLLNKKHGALAKQLDRVLQEMQQNGRMQQIEQQVMAQFFPEGIREQSVAMEEADPD